MPVLIWDSVGDRTFETGVDKGVLYLEGGLAVPWSGLTSVTESVDSEVTSVYFDGMKIQDLVVLGTFSGTMTALTYPDEFEELEGFRPINVGVLVGEQKPQTFNLCYRTLIGNDLEGESAGYKIHILYNVIAIPSDKSFSTISDDSNLTEFEWHITTIPEEISGFAPTSHFVINSLDIDALLLEEFESILYGTSTTQASLPSLSDLITYFSGWFLVQIIDNGDGTITIIAQRAGYINYLTSDLVQLNNMNGAYLDATTVELYDAVSSGATNIQIVDNGDGTWTATTATQNVITVNPDGTFEILNANATFISSDSYQISDT